MSPIVLFIYNRPSHTQQTLEALSQNTLAQDSDLIIFADGPKENATQDQIKKIQETRKVAKSKQWCKSVEIRESEKNKGLAKSIIEGVTEIVNKYGSVIVLEDDIVTGKYFLEYMNTALEKYKDEKKVWHITGFRDPIKTNRTNAAFFSPVMECWSWATWSDRWQYFEKDTDKLLSVFTEEMKCRFNVNDSEKGMFSQIEMNKSGQINTWAIFWYATIFLKDGLCLNPYKSLCRNIGFDNSGVHCGANTAETITDSIDLKITNFPDNLRIDMKEYNELVKFYKIKNRREISLKKILYEESNGYTPLFSIIIPVHNRGKTLKMCIDSILSQTYKEFELILVDDHSTDDSVKICREYCRIDSRIKLFIQSDDKHGAQAARNTGIFNAQYDWIMFNDSDDTWSSEKIEKELKLLKELNFDKETIIYSDCFLINVNTNEKKYWALPHISTENSYKELLIQSGPMFQSLLCSKSLLSKINNLDETVPSYQEWDTSIRLAEYGKFYHIEEALFDYYIGSDDAISKSVEKDFIGRSNILNKFKNEIIKFHGNKVYSSLLAANYRNAITKVNFEELSKNNKIIALFRENLLEAFGQNFSKKAELLESDSSIVRGFRFLFKLPSRLFNKIKAKFHKNLTYSYKYNSVKNKYNSIVYFAQEGNDRLKQLLQTDKPIFVTRFGSVELQTLVEYIDHKRFSANSYYSMSNNAGFFPATQNTLENFSKLYFTAIKEIDVCGCWFNKGEAEILKENAPNSLLVELGCLNSFLFESPYTEVLKGKKVLIIHPFVNTIEKQYTQNRKMLFKDEKVLPEFDLNLLKAPQTIAGNYDDYVSWFDAYEKTCKKIDAINFDIALLGCGAYGLPLGAYIKSKGKTAIHIGGALQLLFGIMGKRWAEDYDYKDRFFNEYWTYPLNLDTPLNSERVENNCYWR